MTIFNDYKTHYNKWSNCESKAIKRTICLRPAQDATREDLSINHEHQAEIEKDLSAMKIKRQLEKAVFLARNKGEAYVIFLDNPAGDEGDLTGNGEINQYSRTVVVRDAIGSDNSINVDNKTIIVSPQRIFKIEGDYDERLKPVSAFHFVENEINALWDIVRSTLQILKKSSIHAMRIDGLDTLIADAVDSEETDLLKATLDDMAKKLNNDSAIFMDSNSSLESVSFNLNGINDVCNELRGIIAGATLPELVLFDKSPQGLSSSRREQLEHYYSLIKSIQETQLSQVYDAIFKYVLIDYADVSYDFKPLDMMSNKEKAEIRQLNIQVADSIISNLGLSGNDIMTVYKALDIVDDLDITIAERTPYKNPYEDLVNEDNTDQE